MDFAAAPGAADNRKNNDAQRTAAAAKAPPRGGVMPSPESHAANDQQPLITLLERIADRDEKALADFYEATLSRVYAVALRIMRETCAAEDVCEEVYMQVWETAKRYDAARGQPLAWLLTIARSRALDALRRQDDAELRANSDELIAEHADEGGDPIDLLSATQQSSAVHAAVATLAPQARQLISLAFFRGMSHSEIADHCKMPLGTVKTIIRRALEDMRNALPALA